MHQPTVSKHLGVLRRAGLVETRRQGLQIFYRVAVPSDPGVSAILAGVLAAIENTSQVREDRQRLDRRATPPPVHLRNGIEPDFLD